MVLVTSHRHESFGPPLANICRALREIVERYRGGVEIVYPVHPIPTSARPCTGSWRVPAT